MSEEITFSDIENLILKCKTKDAIKLTVEYCDKLFCSGEISSENNGWSGLSNAVVTQMKNIDGEN